MKHILPFIALLTFLGQISLADDVYVVIQKKQEAKKNKGWNLADWMATKREMRLMDQWLALNSSATKFEFFLSGIFGKYDYKLDSETQKKEFSQSGGRFGMYFSILGLEGSYLQADEKFTYWDAALALRLLGRSAQGTNLTIKYGMQSKEFSGEQELGLAKNNSNLTLYLIGFMGVDGGYKLIFQDTSSKNFSVEGSTWEAGLFIESGFIRLYGKWFEETTDLSKDGLKNTVVRKGLKYGATFFF